MRELGSQTMHNIGEESRWTSLLLCRAMVGWEIRWACQEIALRPITLTLMGMGRHLSTAFYGSWDIYSYLSVPKVNWPMIWETHGIIKPRGCEDLLRNLLQMYYFCEWKHRPWMKVINTFFLGIYSKLLTWYFSVILFNKLRFFSVFCQFFFTLYIQHWKEKNTI